MEPRPSRRVKFVRADLQSLSASKCLARVELERPESGNYVGSSTGSCPDVEGLKAAARASVEALVQAAGSERHELEVHEVRALEAFGRTAVIVHVAARRGDCRQDLMGLCVVGTDAPQAAAMAVLNAANRFFDVG